MTASDGRHADAALVRRFRHAQTRRERTAVFADVAARHGDAVLGRCAERLWPDADAAVAAACDVLVAARLAMADPAKLARPDQLRGWLLDITVSHVLPSGLPARIDDINWEAVNARAAAGVPEMRDSPARRARLRHWLEQIVATLPESRQRLFDLFVARGLDSRGAARELGTSVAEVQRLRRENRQAVLRAFEVTALAAAEAALGPPGSGAPGCGELRQILADAQHDSGRPEDARRPAAVLPVALRVTVTRHLSQCGTCQARRDDCMRRWGPELLPMLTGTELDEQVTEGLRAVPARPRDALGVHRRAASAGTGGMAVARRAAAAAGAGLVAALLLLAFVWPGFLHSTADFVPRDSTVPSSPDPSSGGLSSTSARPATGTPDGASGQTDGRPADPSGGTLLNRLPSSATGSPAAPSSASPAPSVQHTLPPSTSAPAADPASTPSSSPSALTPSSSATQPTAVPSAPSTSPASSTPPPATATPTTPPSTTAPSSSPSPTSTASSAPSSATPSATAPSATAPPWARRAAALPGAGNCGRYWPMLSGTPIGRKAGGTPRCCRLPFG